MGLPVIALQSEHNPAFRKILYPIYHDEEPRCDSAQRRKDLAVTIYSLRLPGSHVAVSTSVHGLVQLLSSKAPGRYVVEEITTESSFLSPKVRIWGCAIKHDDGIVELVPDSSPI